MNRRNATAIVATCVLLGCLIIFPLLYLGTSTYPVTIVNGNSMYPKLQSGDLVFFKNVQSGSAIPNGTIIVFVSGYSGNSVLDSITRPVIIHRIVGVVVQSDGTIYYRTKGDNNQVNDSQLVKASNVLGTPVLVVTKAGLFFMFITSPQGLVAVIGFSALFYIERGEIRGKKEGEKKTFLGVLAQMVLNDELPERAFRKIELAVSYLQGSMPEYTHDSLTDAVMDWLKKGGLQNRWTVKGMRCPQCSMAAAAFESSRNDLLIVCPHCVSGRCENLSRNQTRRAEKKLHTKIPLTS